MESLELWVWVRLPRTLLRVDRGVTCMMDNTQRCSSDNGESVAGRKGGVRPRRVERGWITARALGEDD